MKSAAAEGLHPDALASSASSRALPLDASWWPYARLAEGLQELAHRVGLSTVSRAAPLDRGLPPPGTGETTRWIEWAAGQIDLDVEAVDATFPDLDALLSAAGPAIAPLHDARGPGFFLMMPTRRGVPRLLGPDGRVRRCPLDALRAVLGWYGEAAVAQQVDTVIDSAAIAPDRRAAVRAALLRERLADERVGPFWMLRLPPSAGFARQLVRAGVRRRVLAVLALFAALYLLEILGWQLIGDAALSGTFDGGWFAAWLLMMASLIPLRLLGRWFDAGLALTAGRLLKARLLAGALRMDVASARRQGMGPLLARVMESQALESLALNGGMTGLTSVLELGLAGWLLGQGAGGTGHVVVFVATLAAIALLAARYAARLRDWTDTRLAMTCDLVERMVGHRTDLAQNVPARRDARDDARLQDYVTRSRAMDRALAPVMAGGPAGWLLVGFAGLAPAFVSGASAPSLAIAVGGVLFAQRALAGIAGSLASLARAAVAWRQVEPLFRAGYGATPGHPFVPARRPSAAPRRTPLLEGRGLSFGYRADRPVLDGLDLQIRHGDRLLLEGSSGSGKSTLAALLTGVQRPQAGLLLLDGMDRPTLGDDWHRLATAAPQFHENHVLSGTFAFNLLMARAWPATAADLHEAGTLCEALGLGPLLRRMPAGLQQRIGETGWQLSHGERSRLFLARALLQKAELTVLDESFAALDPQTLETCLTYVLRESRTLVVIAHP